jgi:hypothetical protein
MTLGEKAGLTLILGAIVSGLAYTIDPNPAMPHGTAVWIIVGVANLGWLLFIACGGRGDKAG